MKIKFCAFTKVKSVISDKERKFGDRVFNGFNPNMLVNKNVIRINIQPQYQGQQVHQVYSNPQVNNNREPMINRQKQEEDDGDCAQGCADCFVMSCRIFLVIFTFGLCLGVLAQRSMN